MERLTVLLLINDLRIGGAERQVVELARGLDTARFRPIVAALYGGQPLEEELRTAGVETVSLGRQHKFDFGIVRVLAQLLRRERVDVIQPFLTPATFIGLVASLWACTPIRIVTERCGLRVSPGLGSNVYRYLEDRLTRWASVAVANSDAGRAYLMERGIRPEAIRVIYNGVGPSRTEIQAKDARVVREQLGLPPDARIAGMVASLQPAKDHDTFLRAAALVADAVPNAYFMVVGDGELRVALETHARGLGLSERVRFTGNISDVARYLSAFDVAVLSSRDHEGCSNALLEAMATARPCIATDVGGNAELVVDGETGFIVPPQSPGRLAEAMVGLLNGPERARAMGQAGQRRLQARFTLERMVQAYEDLYTELWQRHGARQAAHDAIPEARSTK